MDDADGPPNSMPDPGGDRDEGVESPPDSPGWERTRSTIQLKAMQAAVQLGDAVGGTGEAISSRVRNDAGRVRRVTDLFSQGVVGLMLALHLGGTAVLSGVVFAEAFPYAYMYVFMGLLLWLVLTMRFLALKAGRRAAAFRSLVVNLLLTAFWTYVLLDQIPGRPVVEGALRFRTDMHLIWVSIAMYLLAQAGMVAHGVITFSRRIRPDSGGQGTSA